MREARGFSGGSPMVIGGGGMGCLGIIVMIVIVLLGGNPMDYMGGESQPTQTQNQQQDNGNNDIFDTGNVKTDAGNDGAATEQSLDERGQFASVVLKDTEDVWHKIFQDYDKSYTEPRMVLYSDAVRS